MGLQYAFIKNCDGVNSYTYDDVNRIVTATLLSGGTTTYSYDAAGQRIRKAIGSVIEEYAYDSSGHQAGVLQPGTGVKRMELYASGRHLATYDIASNATYFIHGDWQGTERLRTSYSGAAVETCTNLPFGDNQQCTGTDISPMHFTGKPRDTETNLDYFGARYYSSGMARWMSPDWAAKPASVPYANFGDPQSLNLYAYVGNNPVSNIDDDGHEEMGDESSDGGGGGEGAGQVTNYHCPTGRCTTTPKDPTSNPTPEPTGPSPYSSPGGGGGSGQQGAFKVPKLSAPNNGQTKAQCVNAVLTQKFGSFLANKVIPEFSLLSLRDNWKAFAVGTAVSVGVKGTIWGGLWAYGKVLTTTGNNLSAYSGLTTASADALEAGAFWGTTAATAGTVIAAGASAATVFSTGADYWARQQCQNVP